MDSASWSARGQGTSFRLCNDTMSCSCLLILNHTSLTDRGRRWRRKQGDLTSICWRTRNTLNLVCMKFHNVSSPSRARKTLGKPSWLNQVLKEHFCFGFTNHCFWVLIAWDNQVFTCRDTNTPHARWTLMGFVSIHCIWRVGLPVKGRVDEWSCHGIQLQTRFDNSFCKDLLNPLFILKSW